MMTSMKSSIVAVAICFSIYTISHGGWASEHTVFISDQNFTVQHLVITEDVEDELLIEVFRGSLEGDLHSACFLLFEVDVSKVVSEMIIYFDSRRNYLRRLLVKTNTNGIQFRL